MTQKRFPDLLLSCAIFFFLMLTTFIMNLQGGCGTLKKSNSTNQATEYRLKGPFAVDDATLIEYIRRNCLTPPSTDSYRLSTLPGYLRHAKSMTWQFIHDKLRFLFANEPPGFFIEAGALDGEYLSNSLWLEKEKNWTGLLVEPNPISFSFLSAKHRKAWTLNTCISTLPYPHKVVFNIGSPSKQQKVLLTEARLWDQRGHAYEVNRGYESDLLYHEHVVVQCFPLESLLLALNVSVVDFLSLDIQGGEWEVLKLFPWNRVKLRAIVVEYYHKNVPGRVSSEFIDYLKDRGYHLLGTSYEPDYFFVHSNDYVWKRNKKNR